MMELSRNIRKNHAIQEIMIGIKIIQNLFISLALNAALTYKNKILINVIYLTSVMSSCRLL